MTTPPDFGGREIEEGLLEDLGGPRPEQALEHQDETGSGMDDNEAHRADGEWVHEFCPVG